MFEANPEIQKKVDEIRKDSDTVDWISTITSVGHFSKIRGGAFFNLDESKTTPIKTI